MPGFEYGTTNFHLPTGVYSPAPEPGYAWSKSALKGRLCWGHQDHALVGTGLHVERHWAQLSILGRYVTVCWPW